VNRSEIILAGAASYFGGRILKALVARGASVRALVRSGASTDDTDRLTRLGARIVRAD
jgi:uncharacterized protein YbjT (DUF2867 family)